MPRRVPALVSDPVLKFLALASGRRVALTDTGLKHGVALTGGHGATAGARASGPPVVLALHGAPGSHRDFRYLGAYLEPHARVLRLDLPGHGGTPLVHGTTRAGLSARETAAFVAEVLDALQIHSPVHVVGHSLAGMVVGHFAAHHAHRWGHPVCVCRVECVACMPCVLK
jgi:pimeloyl-ACP methyl ester carboxylesterase